MFKLSSIKVGMKYIAKQWMLKQPKGIYIKFFIIMVGFLKMKKESYSSYILVAIDELLNIKSEDGDKFKITIEKLN